MRNYLKQSLFVTIFTITFLFIAISNVGAASSVSFKEDIDYKEGEDITKFDMGTVSYQSETSSSRNPTKSFRIKNNTTETIQLSELQFTDPNTPFEIVGTPASQIYGNDSIQITIQVKKGTNATVPNTSVSTIEFYVNGTERVTVDVEAIIDKAEIPSKPIVSRSYTYTGAEQTFYFMGYIPEYMTIEGDTVGTEVGDYSVTIKFDENKGKNYKWGDGTSDAVVINFSIDKGNPAYNPELYSMSGGAGSKLSTVVLPEGWTWDNPDTVIETGDRSYLASYVDTTGNYYDVTGVELDLFGITQYSVTLPKNEEVIMDVTEDFKIFEGASKIINFKLEKGYVFTSIKVNGVELISSSTMSTPISLSYVKEDIVITVETEYLLITPENNEVIKFIKGSKEDIEFTFNYDFIDFSLVELSVNGKNLSTEDIEKYFTFKEGSVVMNISNEYLSSLEVGTYDVEMLNEMGELFKASFVVEEPVTNPSTGDNIVIYIIALIVTTIAIAGTIIFKKKIINNKK